MVHHAQSSNPLVKPPPVPKREAYDTTNSALSMHSSSHTGDLYNDSEMRMDDMFDYTPPVKRMRATDLTMREPYAGPPAISDMLQGEVARMPYRFVIELHKSSYIKADENIMSMQALEEREKQDIQLACSLREHQELLPPLIIGVPHGYATARPTANLDTCWNNHQLSEFVGGDPNKLKRAVGIRDEFSGRLGVTSYKTLTQLLGILETSIQQVMNN